MIHRRRTTNGDAAPIAKSDRPAAIQTAMSEPGADVASSLDGDEEDASDPNTGEHDVAGNGMGNDDAGIDDAGTDDTDHDEQADDEQADDEQADADDRGAADRGNADGDRRDSSVADQRTGPSSKHQVSKAATRASETGQDEPGQSVSGQDKTGQDETGKVETGQDKPVHDEAGEPDTAANPGPQSSTQIAFRVATVAVLFPIVFAALRNAVSNWVPIGDSAYFTARSLDVGTSHTPLVGAWSSGSLDYAHPVNSLGPLELYLLAPFTHLAPGAGTAIGVALVQFAAVATIIVLLRRQYGDRGTLAALVGIAWLVWAMGSENLVAAVQHPYLILPFAASMVATVAALGGQRWSLLVLVVFGSLCVQTHLSYPLLVAALLLIAAVGQWSWWRCSDPVRRAQINRSSAIAVATGIVLWIPPLIDQFFGTGNLVAALTQGGGDEYPTGLRLGTRILATVATQPSTLGSRGFADIHLNEYIASGVRGAILLAAIAAIGAVALWAGKTRRSNLFYWTLVLSAVGVAMVINASLIPGSIFGYRIDNYRWMWAWLGVGAAATWMGIDFVLSGRRFVGPDVAAAWRRRGPLVLATIVCGFGTWNLAQRGMPNMITYRAATDDVSALATQLDTYLDTHQVDGPVLIDDTHLYFGAPYNYPITAVFLRHRIEVRFQSEIYGYRFGRDRVADGTEPLELTIWVDDEALARQQILIAYSDVLQPVGLELAATGGSGDG